MFNILSVAINTYSGFGTPFSLDPLGQIIKALIEGCGSIGVGIILFTLILKLITMPLDVFSRISTKKNSLKMEKMRPQLEKLQRQYANNKALYNEKMQALYKKEGYSMFSSCLPMIVTIVIFIIVINQFTNYSRYTNLTMINNIAESYTKAVVSYADEHSDTLTVVRDANGNVTEIYVNDNLFESSYCLALREGHLEKTDTSVYYLGSFKTTDIDSLAKLVKQMNDEGYTYYAASEQFIYDEAADKYSLNLSRWDQDVVKDYIVRANEEHGNYITNKDDITAAEVEDYINSKISESLVNYKYGKYVDEEIKPVGRAAGRESYLKDAPRFLWVKNLWVPDLPWKHPVFEKLSEYDFYNKLVENGMANDAEFEEITAGLSDEKSQPNGYLILVILSIGVMFLSQFLTNKMQKAQMELQTVDGQAAQTSKMMMWMMPIMFGVFAFIYTASFSLYMIASSVISLLVTVLTNYFVEKHFAKKAAQEELDRDKRIAVKKDGENNAKKQ
ncbi:MAG: YidC/Oxa1 family membrane protein insertase [Clostridia bacterium]|nr:YidC/Oxa1 family membrane protein insertase [Clostridia bacterium]